jgi:BlaI family transcriptional regulator, penicillinase repressor
MGKRPVRSSFSRREREIMEVIYRLGGATAAQVAEAMPAPPSYSAVRAMLSILVSKGHLRHETRANRYLYLPTVSHEKARLNALNSLVRTFFGGSAREAAVALIDQSGRALSAEDLEEIRRRIEEAIAEGR